jgi:hypothetical protein
MRSLITVLRATLPALAVLTVGGTASLAGGFSHDRVYADSFGNLVIESAAGYKRIIVGEGGQAEQLSKYTSAGQADIDVVYADGAGRHVVNDCYRPPALIKGRSYMYGFDEGEIPFQGGPCR